MLLMAHKTPKVRHLLLKDRDTLPMPIDFSAKETRGMDAIRALFSYDDLSNEDRDVLIKSICTCGLYNKYVEECNRVMGVIPFAFQHVLSVLSPHLESLTCAASPSFCPTWLPISFSNITFPSLIDLTLYGCRLEDQVGALIHRKPIAPRAGTDSPSQPFPNVKFLHLAFTYEDTGYFANLVPHITHLRITGPLNADRGFLEDLSSLIATPRSSSADQSPSERANFRGLKHVSLLPCKDYFWAEDESASFPKYLADLVEADERGMVDIIEPSVKALGSRGSEYVERLYGFREVDEDWEDDCDRLYPEIRPQWYTPKKHSDIKTLRQFN
ncbi:hypothetical protein NLI96_g10851 [Meripilus lineatus]|uniref:Uncharacterized protein n=1 Tax=Meripilus lineatus TaxID=2056292 RepID=A0AAD5Y8X8_9APHY|nr:hypothetical protein NLI96_g10851 [Physisporinus lineatus]